MKVKVSSKYQVVIPKTARRKLHLSKSDVYMEVTRITDQEITFSKVAPPQEKLMEYAGLAKDVWGKNPVAALRKQRDQDWK